MINWKSGILRLAVVSCLCWMMFVPFEASPSLFSQTRSSVDGAAASYSWEEANLEPNQIILPPDKFAARVGQMELLTAGSTAMLVFGLWLAGWVVAGFRRA
jgi:hypothetical protein